MPALALDRSFLPAPAAPLGPGQLHLWAIPLDADGPAVEVLAATLSADERLRAARFGTEELRRRFIVGRGRLRAILAGYLAAAPGELEFQYEDRGKPALAAAWRAAGLHFNLSHCRGLALAAVADRDVGVDVEQVRPVQNVEQLVERCFADAEKEEWRRLPPAARPLGFFLAWTRKEAWLKAVGSGLSFPLDRVRVSLAPGEASRLLSIGGDAQAAAAWWLDSCEPAAGHVAAVALRGPPAGVSRWTPQDF
jgi:4'-phosphopantetheinyl transferase